MQIGAPSALPNPAASLIYGIDQWLNSPSSVSVLYFTNNVSLRVPMGQLPLGANTFSIQFVSMLAGSVCGNPNYTMGASPALIFQY